MPPKKNELQLFEMLEEALKPIKDAMQKLITDGKNDGTRTEYGAKDTNEDH